MKKFSTIIRSVVNKILCYKALSAQRNVQKNLCSEMRIYILGLYHAEYSPDKDTWFTVQLSDL